MMRVLSLICQSKVKYCDYQINRHIFLALWCNAPQKAPNFLFFHAFCMEFGQKPPKNALERGKRPLSDMVK
jgi:hypothetical protein